MDRSIIMYGYDSGISGRMRQHGGKDVDGGFIGSSTCGSYFCAGSGGHLCGSIGRIRGTGSGRKLRCFQGYTGGTDLYIGICYGRFPYDGHDRFCR